MAEKVAVLVEVGFHHAPTDEAFIAAINANVERVQQHFEIGSDAGDITLTAIPVKCIPAVLKALKECVK